MPVQKLLNEIARDDIRLTSSQMADLSQMTVADLPSFKKAWGKASIVRRRSIMSQLIELAKDNVELNFDLIFKHGLSDSDEEVRTAAIDGLWENRDPALIRKLIDLMQNDASENVRASAATALGKFTVLVECGEIRESYRNTLGQALLATVDDIKKPVEVRRRALEAVAPLSIPAVREAIKNAYDSRDERFIISAIYAMGRTCDDAWLPILYKELDNADAEIRYEAAGACGEIGMEESVPHLAEHIHDPDIEVRLAVIQSLGKIGGVEAKKSLQRVAKDNNVAIREAIEQALAEIDTMEDMTFFEMNSSTNDRYDNRN